MEREAAELATNTAIAQRSLKRYRMFRQLEVISGIPGFETVRIEVQSA